jgi:outer membrane usher protein
MWSRQTNIGLAVLIAFALAPQLARAEATDSDSQKTDLVDTDTANTEPTSTDPAGTEPVVLQLDVQINGYPLKLIAAFTQLPDGRMAATRSELTDIGVVVPGEGAVEELITLDKVPGLKYVYDEATQTIDITLPNEKRVSKNVKIGSDQDMLEAQSGTGLVLNYIGYVSGDYTVADAKTAINGANLSLDARAFSKFGTLRQTGILGTTTFADFTALRLDSSWTYSDQAKMRTYRLGDIISGGLRWTRPVRMGGAQVQRNFSLRPDLITMPLPFIAGTAAVPSTLDVYVGDLKTYSGSIDPGRFNIDNIPVYTNSGKARLVLTDATGRSVESESYFFTSPDLLKRNLYDFSADMGVVRRNFGSDSFGYDDELVGLGSLRYGLNDAITGEAHIEAKSDLVDAGIGALFSGRQLGMFNVAVAASQFGADQGLFLHAGWEGNFGNLSVQASTSRTLGNYFDLAAATELPVNGRPFTGGVPRAVDQVSFGYSLPEIKSGAGLSFIHEEKLSGDQAYILSGSISHSFENSMSLFINGYSDFGDNRDYGVFAGLSMSLGHNISSSAGINSTRTSVSASAEISHPFGDKPGDYGWRVSRNQAKNSFTSASASYRTGKGVISGNIDQHGSTGVSANAAMSGAVVVAGGGVFAGDHVDDAFAVVDAGAAGVNVKYENRNAGKTGKNGKLLLPGLHAYQKNKIEIDVNDLPLGASVAMSETEVVPADAAGLVVNFGVKQDAAAVLLTLTDDTDKFLPEGSEVLLQGSTESFFVGYDGAVYVTGAAAHNRITVKLATSLCEASFDYKPGSGDQTSIGPVKCI